MSLYLSGEHLAKGGPLQIPVFLRSSWSGPLLQRLRMGRNKKPLLEILQEGVFPVIQDWGYFAD
jgi:hypothetical protein